MGSELKLAVLGDLRVFRGSQTVPLPPSKKTRALFAYLAVIQRPQRRERLCEMFWEIPDDPRGALCTEAPVRLDKAALSSGCKPHPATAPAGSNRSSYADKDRLLRCFDVVLDAALTGTFEPGGIEALDDYARLGGILGSKACRANRRKPRLYSRPHKLVSAT